MGVPDTTNVKTKNFPPIKPDWYYVTFDSFEDKVDKNDDDYTEIALKFLDSEKTAWCNLSHKEEFLWKIKEFKQAISMADDETDLSPYINKRLKAFIQNRKVTNAKTKEETNYPDVRKFRPFDDSNTELSPSTKVGGDLPF